MESTFKSGVACVLGGFAILCFAVSPASALVFNVTNTNDTYSYTSLRGAVMAANWFGGKNTIILGGQPPARGRNQPPPRVFHLTISGADEDAARTGDLDITRGDLTIIGATSDVVIDATGLGDRVFQVFPHARLTMKNLTITGGHSPDGINYGSNADGEPGGAIYNGGTLILENCIVIGNSSGNANYASPDGGNGGKGGGIYNSDILIMDSCIVAENICGTGVNDDLGIGQNGGNGGGIYNCGITSLEWCIVSNNFSGQGAAGGSPPGGYVIGASGGQGGAGGDGGGIYNAGEINFIFCTVNDNGSGNGGAGYDAGSGGNGGNGGGIFNSGGMTMDRCIFAL